LWLRTEVKSMAGAAVAGKDVVVMCFQDPGRGFERDIGQSGLILTLDVGRTKV